MRCRECGFELDERDRLRNGAYQCPECGAIHHTASSSRVSPSPWRRKRRSSFASSGNLLTEQRFGLPLWSLGAIVLAIAAAVILLAVFSNRGGDGAEPSVPEDAPQVTAPADSELSDGEAPDGAGASPEVPSGPAPEHNTGVAQNDFVVGFDWAMSYLGYNSSLNLESTEVGAGGSSVQNYNFEDWFTLKLTVDPATNIIYSASAHAQVDWADNVPSLAALVSTVYGFDNSINAGNCRAKIERMISDNTRVYNAKAFSATLTSSTSEGYNMEFTGKL